MQNSSENDSVADIGAAAGEFKVNRPAAIKACASARSCLAQDDTDAVESLLIGALKSRPSCNLAYQLLGQRFKQSGDEKEAATCFQGRLPARLLHKYFKPRHLQAIAAKPEAAAADEAGESVDHYTRASVFKPEHVALPAPGTLSGARSEAFRRTEIVSRECFVDTVEHCELWHDSSSTLVFDAKGKEITAHTVGDLPVLCSMMQQSRPRRLQGLTVLLGARGSHNYYHWLADIIPKLGILVAAGVHLKSVDHFVVPLAAAGFARDLLVKAGVSDDQIFESETETPFVSADKLVVPFLSNKMGYSMGRWLPRYLQQTMLWRQSRVPAGNRKLFINRVAQTAAGRTLHNQQDTEKYFVQRGFEIVIPEKMSVTEQAELFAQAGVVVAAHGAGLSNIVYCAPGTRVIEFYGAHIAPCYWAISALNELDYYHHCCIDQNGIEGSDSARRSAGFSIPLEVAGHMLDLAGVR